MTACSSQILVGRAGVEPTTNGLKVRPTQCLHPLSTVDTIYINQHVMALFA